MAGALPAEGMVKTSLQRGQRPRLPASSSLTLNEAWQCWQVTGIGMVYDPALSSTATASAPKKANTGEPPQTFAAVPAHCPIPHPHTLRVRSGGVLKLCEAGAMLPTSTEIRRVNELNE